jgi:Lipocalin-like domain
MTSNLIGAAALLFLLTSSGLVAAQDLASQLVGVWKRTESVRQYVDGGEPVKRELGGVAIFTRGGLFAVTLYYADRKAPAGAVPTDEELAALARSSFSGSGTYKVEGDTVVLRYDSSSNPSWIGAERRATMKIADKVLTWTSPQYTDATGKPGFDVITQVRLE